MTPLEMRQNIGLGSVLDNLLLNNSLTHSNLRYFKFSGKISKYDPCHPSWRNLTLPGKRFNFYLAIIVASRLIRKKLSIGYILLAEIKPKN